MQLQLSTFLSLEHFFNDLIRSPGKQFERFPLVHTGFSGKTAVLFGTLQNLFGICWKGLWRLSCPPSLLKVASITADCSGLHPLGVWISSGIEAPEPLRATCFSIWLFTQSRSGFLCLNRTHPTFQAVPVTSCAVTGHHWAVCVLYSSHQVLIHVDKISLNHLSSRLGSAAPALSASPFCSRCFHSYWKGSSSEALIGGSVLNDILQGAKTVSEQADPMVAKVLLPGHKRKSEDT